MLLWLTLPSPVWHCLKLLGEDLRRPSVGCLHWWHLQSWHLQGRLRHLCLSAAPSCASVPLSLDQATFRILLRATHIRKIMALTAPRAHIRSFGLSAFPSKAVFFKVARFVTVKTNSQNSRGAFKGCKGCSHCFIFVFYWAYAMTHFNYFNQTWILVWQRLKEFFTVHVCIFNNKFYKQNFTSVWIINLMIKHLLKAVNKLHVWLFCLLSDVCESLLWFLCIRDLKEC